MKESTEARVEKLERELGRVKRRNLWLWGGTALMVGLLALAWACLDIGRPAQAQEGATVHREIRAEKFVLVDKEGRVRAVLGADKDGAGLGLFDEKDRLRAGLVVTKKGAPGLHLLDEQGEVRAGLGVTKDGPGLSLFDEKGKIVKSFNITY